MIDTIDDAMTTFTPEFLTSAAPRISL